MELEATNEAPTGPALKKAKFGTQQMQDLLSALQNNTLSKTQGKNYKAECVSGSDAIKLLKDKLKSVVKESDVTNFNYLDVQNYKSNGEKTSLEVVTRIKKELLEQYGACLLQKYSYKQARIPNVAFPASKSEKDKFCGLLQIQATTLARLLAEAETEEELISCLQRDIALIDTEGLHVGAHICRKQACQNHTVFATSGTNIKQHDTCPAYWIVDDTAINFCSCNAKQRCIYPGPLHNLQLHTTILQTLLKNYVHTSQLGFNSP